MSKSPWCRHFEQPRCARFIARSQFAQLSHAACRDLTTSLFLAAAHTFCTRARRAGTAGTAHNRAPSLDALLTDLSTQRFGGAFEILVVDNRSSDETVGVVGRHRARDRRVHYLFEGRPGASCARLRYRDTIDARGRIDDGMPARGRSWWGVPGFLYHEWFHHASSWMRNIAIARWNRAFLDECRLRYLTSYVVTRWRSSA